MTSFLFLPPLAFSLILAAVFFLSRRMKRLSFRGELGPGARKPYSCGEDMPTNTFRPEYAQFFPFAFFFTIMHVVALVLGTMPSGVLGFYLMAAVYIAGILIGLGVLVRETT